MSGRSVPSLLFGSSVGSSVFSVKAVVDLLMRLDWNSLATVLGAAFFTALSWLISARARMAAQKREELEAEREAEREQDRLDREAKREQEWLDFIQRIRIQSIEVRGGAGTTGVQDIGPAAPITESKSDQGRTDASVSAQ